MRIPLVIAGLMLATAAQAQTLPGNPAQGKAIAQRACAGCHLIGEGQTSSTTDGVPTFAALARNPRMNDAALHGFVQAPHPPMPDLALSRQELDDVVSYIMSLRAP